MKKKNTVELLRAVAKVSLVAGLFVSSQFSFAETKKPNTFYFFEPASMSGFEISPDGKHVSFLVKKDKDRRKLVMLDTETMEMKVITGYTNADIYDIHWVNNDRLTFSTYESENAPGQIRFYPGLFAVNADGSDMRTLIDPNPNEASTTGSHIVSKALPGRTFFFDVDRSNTSEEVFVWQPVDKSDTNYDRKAQRLIKLNTKTGRFSNYDRPGDTIQWLIDQYGVPRLNVISHDGNEEVFYLDPANEKWRKIGEFKAYGDAHRFSPEYFAPDGSLYVTATLGRDNSALYKFDFAKNAIDPEPVIGVKGYDFDVTAEAQEHFDDRFIVNQSTKKLLGVNYQTDASATLWFDEDAKKIQKSVDALLPNTINMLSFGRSGAMKYALVRAFSDVQPVQTLIYNVESNKLALLSKSKEHIDPKQMSQQDMVHIQARDGMDIPAYLTLPRGAGKKNLPMVVLVHGGPYVRGAAWGWDPEVQFLASRGYAVLQPEFRGSDGFGQKHLTAGFKQWGLAMQDDVADAAKWAIAQGYADPKRMCIAGASYGGYATLMGLAKNPELFQCGVEWVGVSDINLMFKDSWTSDLPEAWRHFGMPVMIGDPVKDADMIKANSPVNIPQKITQPLLMAYGGVDRRVPIEHGEKMRDALKPYNKNVEWIEYPYEGHGWFMPNDQVDFWTHVEKFLDANIGKAQ